MRTETMPGKHTASPAIPFSWPGFARGVRLALPVMMGYFPVGFAFGVLAVGAGITAFDAVFMSFAVYAGSAQLIAADLVQAGIAAVSIILTTFIVNLRHMLMSAAVSPHLAGFSKPWLALFSAEMTDETFALHIARFSSGTVDKGEILGINAASHAMWVVSGLFGALLGDVFTDVKPYGLDYALCGMFIGLLLPHCRIPRRLAAALLASGLAVFFTLSGLADWSAILATAISATVIVVLTETPGKKRHAR